MTLGHKVWHVFVGLVVVGVPLLGHVLPSDVLNLTLGGVLLLLEDWARHAAEA